MSSNEVINYYNQSFKNYRIFWGLDNHLGLHVGFYDEQYKTHNEAILNMNRVLARESKITDQDKFLDAGCGIGGSTIWLAQNIGSQGVGININEMQLKIAQEIAQERKVDHLVNFMVTDFTSINIPDSSFDVVWGLEAICYAENKKKFLQEAKRVLKSGGRLIVADGFRTETKPDSIGKSAMSKWLEGWVVPDLVSVNEFSSYLKELGFKNIQYTNITKNVMPSSKRMYAMSYIIYPLCKVLQLVGIKLRTSGITAARYQYIALKKNLWEYGIFYAENKN